MRPQFFQTDQYGSNIAVSTPLRTLLIEPVTHKLLHVRRRIRGPVLAPARDHVQVCLPFARNSSAVAGLSIGSSVGREVLHNSQPRSSLREIVQVYLPWLGRVHLPWPDRATIVQVTCQRLLKKIPPDWSRVDITVLARINCRLEVNRVRLQNGLLHGGKQ